MATPTGTLLLSSVLQFPLAPFSGKSSAPSAVQMAPRRAPAAVLASKGYNVQIVVDEGEGEDSIFRRFRREVMKAGLLQEIKRRRRHENAKDIKIRKAREAGRRNRRRRMMDDRRFPEDEGDSEAVRTRRDEDNDNWEVSGIL
uniref:Uncharacterized protein n=1 Tax=Avena sativa TaxID=4498 RepID=A0ACD5YRM5_AVESA